MFEDVLVYLFARVNYLFVDLLVVILDSCGICGTLSHCFEQHDANRVSLVMNRERSLTEGEYRYFSIKLLFCDIVCVCV